MLALRRLSTLALSASVRASAPAAFARASPIVARQFSAAAFVRSHGKSDRDLAHKLESELKFEKENAETGVPSFIQAFNNRGVFKIEDKVGEKEVTLVRNFGNEKISVIFSTDAIADKAEFDDTESDQDEQFAVNVTIVIEKKAATDNGALEILATVQDNAFFVDSVRFNPSSTIMTAQNAEADWQCNGSYGGPVFQDLDEGLQDQFHDFLRERGFDEALAEFVPQYIDFKEQNEYTEWLKRVGEWVAK